MRESGRMADRMLSTRQAAAIMGMRPRYVRDLCVTKAIPAVQIGRNWRLCEHDVRAWLRARAEREAQGVMALEVNAAGEVVCTLERVASELGISLHTAAQYAEYLGGYKVANRWRIPWDAVQQARVNGLPRLPKRRATDDELARCVVVRPGKTIIVPLDERDLDAVQQPKLTMQPEYQTAAGPQATNDRGGVAGLTLTSAAGAHQDDCPELDAQLLLAIGAQLAETVKGQGRWTVLWNPRPLEGERVWGRWMSCC